MGPILKLSGAMDILNAARLEGLCLGGGRLLGKD
jgi:hypothetical protein